jgi:hypothetical protein
VVIKNVMIPVSQIILHHLFFERGILETYSEKMDLLNIGKSRSGGVMLRSIWKLITWLSGFMS